YWVQFQGSLARNGNRQCVVAFHRDRDRRGAALVGTCERLEEGSLLHARIAQARKHDFLHGGFEWQREGVDIAVETAVERYFHFREWILRGFGDLENVVMEMAHRSAEP